MLLVKTRIGPSKINGIGLFAAQFIPAGTTVWKFQPPFDLKVRKDELANLSEPGGEQFLKYSYLDNRTSEYVLCYDDARFFNHSDDANCIDAEFPGDPEGITAAARDIEEGEELTCNYKEFDADFEYKMSQK